MVCLSVMQSMTSVNPELVENKERGCQYCGTPNPDNNFYCKDCGKRANPPLFTVNMWMRTDRGSRTDVEFNERTMGDSITRMWNQKRGYE